MMVCIAYCLDRMILSHLEHFGTFWPAKVPQSLENGPSGGPCPTGRTSNFLPFMLRGPENPSPTGQTGNLPAMRLQPPASHRVVANFYVRG